MSFRTSCPVASSPFELLRRSFLQTDGLTFGDALNADQIEQAFAAEGVSFGQPGGGGQPPVYTMALTLWAMLSQALFTDLQRSCRAAVLRVAVYYALLGRQVSTNTGAYCRARAKIGEGVVRRLTQGVAQRCEADIPEEWKWMGMTVRLVDGSDLSMPDTPENLAAYPQSRSQAPGGGFPLLRIVVLVSLATGMVSALASPNRTLLWNLSLLSKESVRRTLDFMRFRNSYQLFDASQRNKESDSHSNESTLRQRNLLV